MSERNVVAININSADRIDINNSTSNFAISLRKSLRNIAAIEVSNIVIPKSEFNIDVNNNVMSGAIVVAGIETTFFVQLTDGDYDAVSLAALVASALNGNTTMISFPITWAVSYSSVIRRMSITATYSLGDNVTWAVRLDHTALINTLGIGSASTAAQTYTATTTATILSIPCNRTPIIGRGLTYNITSTRLTNNINTSYLRSLGKGFIVDNSNDLIKINASITTNEYITSIPLPVAENKTAQQNRGDSVAISADGNIVASGAFNFGVYIFRRDAPGSAWSQSTPGSILGTPAAFGQGGKISLSGNGNTLAVGCSTIGSGRGGVYIFTRIGNVWTQQGDILVGTGAIGMAEQGSSVSLSTNGDTLAVGGQSDNSGIGACWIFVRSAGIWTQQTKLIPSTPLGLPLFGRAVSISGSGNKIAVGGPNDNSVIGAFWWFVRTTTTWSAGTKIIPATLTGSPRVGSDVSVSADGGYVAISGPADSATGATWVYLWSGGAPIEQQKIVAATRGVITGPYTTGGSCAINSAGDTLVIGARSNDLATSGGTLQGSTSVWVRLGATWASQASNLVGDVSDTPSAQFQGYAVAVSANGDELVTGGPIDNNIAGAAWVFSRAGIAWAQDGPKLIGTGGTPVDRFGKRLALSADGQTMLVGLPDFSSGVGRAFVYTLVGVNWVQQAELSASNKIGAANEGQSVALSGDGNIAAVGGNADNSLVGAVWIYTRSAGVWSQLTKLALAGFSNQGRYIALNAAGDTLIIGSSSIPGVRVMNQIGVSWVEKIAGLGSTALGGPPAESLAISDDGLTFVMSATGVGAAVFVLTSNAWVQQGPNFISLVTLVDSASPTFGSTCVISPDGNRIAVSSINDGTAGCGATYIFNRSASLWAQQGVGLVGVANRTANAQGTSLAFFNAGDSIAIGAPTAANFVGRVWIFDLSSGAWAQRGVAPLLGSVNNGAFGSALSGAGKKLAIGEPYGDGTTGNVFVHTDFGDITSFTIRVLVPIKSYTVFDLVSFLNRSMADIVTSGSGYTASFNNLSALTLTSYFTNPIISSTFAVDPASTFTLARWPDTNYMLNQVSSGINFSINNDVLKTVVNHSDNSDNVIVDTTRDIQYRKYPAGYTVAANDIVDIQLRDDRDRIVDLQGADWVMTIYATVRS